jgi:GAF domain-containing protein
MAALLGELARSITGALDLDTILQTVAEGARELCRSDLSAIALREAETGVMVFRYRAGERLEDGERRVVVPGRGAGGLALETGKAVRSDNALRDPRFTDDAG